MYWSTQASSRQTAVPAQADQPNAGTLSQWCTQHIRHVDGAVLEPNQAIEAASCLAYIRGALDSRAMYTRNGGRRAYCAPDSGIRLDDLARASAKSTAGSGQMIDRLEAVLVEAFPCPR